MSSSVPPDLSRWLATATRGLPPDVAALTRAEIAAHYEDALDGYTEQGMTPAEAHGRVMADLGAADRTSRGLSDVHRGQRHYRIAAVGSLVFLFMLFLLPSLLESLGVSDALVIALAELIITCTLEVYVLLVLKWLVNWRLDLHGIDQAFALLIGGIIGERVLVLLSVALLGSGSYLAIGRTLPAATSSLHAVLLLFVHGSDLACGLGVLILGLKVFKANGALYGLSVPLGLLGIALGLLLCSAVFLPYLGAMRIALLAYIGGLLINVVMWPLFTLLFFRAAYRSPVHPARFA